MDTLTGETFYPRSWAMESNDAALEFDDGSGMFTMTSLTGKSATAKVTIEDDTWTEPLSLSLKLTVNRKLSTAKLSKATLTLNAAYPAITDSAIVTASNANEHLDGSLTNLVCRTAHAEKLKINYRNGVVTGSIRDTTVKPGTYKFTFTPRLQNTVDDSGNVVRGAELKPLTVTVKVINTDQLGATVSAAGKLDAVRRETSSILYTVTKLNNVVGSVTDIRLSGEIGLDEGLFTLDYVPQPSSGWILPPPLTWKSPTW